MIDDIVIMEIFKPEKVISGIPTLLLHWSYQFFSFIYPFLSVSKVLLLLKRSPANLLNCSFV